jgi:hypothetical protein
VIHGVELVMYVVEIQADQLQPQRDWRQVRMRMAGRRRRLFCGRGRGLLDCGFVESCLALGVVAPLRRRLDASQPTRKAILACWHPSASVCSWVYAFAPPCSGR